MEQQAHERRERFIEVNALSKILELKLINEIFEKEDYLSLGFETFEAFCQAPKESGGLDISKYYAKQLIDVYNKFVKDLGVTEDLVMKIGPRKLYSVRHLVNKDNLQDTLSMAESLSAKDLKLEMTGITPEKCEHDFVPYYKCNKCGTWKKTL